VRFAVRQSSYKGHLFFEYLERVRIEVFIPLVRLGCLCNFAHCQRRIIVNRTVICERMDETLDILVVDPM
jgi:hypothetical protein